MRFRVFDDVVVDVWRVTPPIKFLGLVLLLRLQSDNQWTQTIPLFQLLYGGHHNFTGEAPLALVIVDGKEIKPDTVRQKVQQVGVIKVVRFSYAVRP